VMFFSCLELVFLLLGRFVCSGIALAVGPVFVSFS